MKQLMALMIAPGTGYSCAMSRRIQVLQGDITRQQVEAIVNAANASLLGAERSLGWAALTRCIARGRSKRWIRWTANTIFW